MAAYAVSTTDRPVKRRAPGLVAFPVADNVTLRKGCFVMASAAGYATPCDGSTASLVFLGIADETVDNTQPGHAAGGKWVRVWQDGIFELAAAGTITAADLGAEVWIQTGTNGNDYTVLNVNESDPGIAIKVGRITRVLSASLVEVDITDYAGRQAGSAN